MRKHPKISIVTVCLNAEEYLEDCLRSVMNQTYDHIEHIVVDGGSTDGTLDILKRYEGRYDLRWISEPDDGMYDALRKGFARATGDIFAWLNSDDFYLPWACELAAKVMEKTSARWCTGIPCHYTERGVAHNIPRITPVFPRKFIRKGYMDGRVATFLQQESMFWSRELWEKCSGAVAGTKLAGDYRLWRAFAEHEPLHTLDSVISGFRIRPGQQSANREKYYAEIEPLTFGRRILARTGLVRILLTAAALTDRKLRIKTKRILYEEDPA